jgi:hypothetical protein
MTTPPKSYVSHRYESMSDRVQTDLGVFEVFLFVLPFKC